MRFEAFFEVTWLILGMLFVGALYALAGAWLGMVELKPHLVAQTRVMCLLSMLGMVFCAAAVARIRRGAPYGR